MFGLILCGGNSTRMGTDKGLLPYHSTTWAGWAASKLDAMGLQTFLSVNDAQLPSYLSFFPAEKMIADNPVLHCKGPLRGLLSAHLQFKSDDIFVLACDMLLMHVSLMNELLHAFAIQKPAACVFNNNGHYEPLCGIYTSVALAQMAAEQDAGQLKNFSMMQLLQQVNTYSLPVSTEQQKFFSNINGPGELDAANLP